MAAGKGTRMNGESPKAAAQFNGAPMGGRVVEAVRGAGVSRVLVVVGHQADAVRAAIGDSCEYVRQEPLLGTGHALLTCREALSGFRGAILTAYADLPLLRPSDLSRLLDAHLGREVAASLVTVELEDAGRYGRVIRNSHDWVARIVEARDASPEELAVREINVGAYCFEAPLIFDVLAELRPRPDVNEIYLTDAIAGLRARGHAVQAVPIPCAEAGLGINTTEDLLKAQEALSRLRRG